MYMFVYSASRAHSHIIMIFLYVSDQFMESKFPENLL